MFYKEIQEQAGLGSAFLEHLEQMDNRNQKFFKKNSIIAQFKVLNERISKSACFLKFGQVVPGLFAF